MNRITMQFLQAVCDRINRMAGTPLAPYVKDANGKYQPQAHCYHLSQAYGGVSLHQMCAEGTGVHDVLGCGHIPKRELADRMAAFIAGFDHAKN